MNRNLATILIISLSFLGVEVCVLLMLEVVRHFSLGSFQ